VRGGGGVGREARKGTVSGRCEGVEARVWKICSRGCWSQVTVACEAVWQCRPSGHLGRP
jgi:hypothetical protein